MLWVPFTVIAVLVHLVALYLPGAAGATTPAGWDKVAHVLLFAVPVWLLGWLSGRVWPVVWIFAVHAVVSEVVQARFVPYREGSGWDAVADLAGIVLAVGLLDWQRRRGRG